MSRDRFVPPHRTAVEYLGRQVVDKNWGQAMFDVASELFSNAVQMEEPESLRVSLLTDSEMRRLSRIPPKDSARIEAGIYELKTHEFSDGLTVSIAEVKIKKPDRIVASLVEDDILTRERRAVLNLISRLMKDDFSFHHIESDLDLGTLLDRNKRDQVVHEFTESPVPDSVSLGQSVLGLIINGVDHKEI